MRLHPIANITKDKPWVAGGSGDLAEFFGPNDKGNRGDFIPMESEPEVFTEYAHYLGLDNHFEFQEYYPNIDNFTPAMMPNIIGVIVLFNKGYTEDSAIQPCTDTSDGKLHWRENPFFIP